MLHFEIPDTTAHIPDDIFFLPVVSEGRGESVIGLVYDMERRIIGSLEAPLIEWDQGVTAFEEIVTIFGFRWLMVDLPELAVSLFVPEFIDMSSEGKYRISIFIEEFCREIEVSRIRPIMHDISKE